MRVARPVVSFGVGFLRNESLHLQSNMEKAAVAGRAGRRTRTPLQHAPAWLTALVTTDPAGGVSGTSPGLGGCSEGTAG